MKHDYQKRTDAIVDALGTVRPSLLLHCCCGPCGSYVLEYLCRYFDVTALFYNPNIFPAREYEERFYWLGELIGKQGGKAKIAQCARDQERFDEITRGLENEPEGGARCTACFALRLSETARRAKEGRFDYFCTTLSVSPHKDAERINSIGFELEGQLGVKWLPADFKKREGYKRSIELSKEYGLYRQEYCGCLFSLEAEEKIKKKDN